MLLHVVKETDAGIIVRGAKYETAAAYANQAFTKPTIAKLGRFRLFRLRRRLHLRSQFAPAQVHLPHRLAGRAPADDYPLSNRFDEVDTLVIFDDVMIPCGERCCVLPAHQGGPPSSAPRCIATRLSRSSSAI